MGVVSGTERRGEAKEKITGLLQMSISEKIYFRTDICIKIRHDKLFSKFLELILKSQTSAKDITKKNYGLINSKRNMPNNC